MPLSQNVYPDLLLARILFSIGGASASCMLTAIIPVVTDQPLERTNGHQAGHQSSMPSETSGQQGSIDGNESRDSSQKVPEHVIASASQVAGVVGVFSGLGALIALLLLLRLPSVFRQHIGVDSAKGIQLTYCITAILAVFISVTTSLI